MGRKPNPIVLEHFIRGAKINDNSNRYFHTCRNCNQEFDRGRHEQLTAHMTDDCPSLTDEERAKILLKLHGLEHAAGSGASNQNGTGMGRGRNIDLPFSPSRPENFDGLNVLAEASRRVGIQVPMEQGRASGNSPPLDPALQQDLPNQFVNTSDDEFDGYASTTNGLQTTTAPGYAPLFSYMPAQLANGPLGPQRGPGLGIDIGAAPVTPSHDLSSLAASANATLAHSLLPDIFEPSARQTSAPSFGTANGTNRDVMDNDAQSRIFSFPITDQAADERQDEPMTQEDQEAAAFPRPIAINPNLNRSTVFVEETGTSAKSQKAKQRSAFNPQRKKEVQEMRLRGVCIRCKMLKKPCGVETPCKPCKEIDNHRLWGPCTRWDFKKDLKFYTTPLHSTLAQSDVNNIKNQISFQPFDGHIVVSLIDSLPAKILVPAQQGQHGSHAIHPQYGISMQRRHYQKSEDIFVFQISRKDFTAKLEKCLASSLRDVCARETSPLMRSILMTAHKLAAEKDSKLLAMVLELWGLTYTLSGTNLNTTFEAVPAQLSTTASPPQLRHDIAKEVNMYSYSLLSSQLRAALAERASEVKKKTMATFEAQFMKGPTTPSAKSERFETFLASIILVNAAERYTWLFKVFEQGLPDAQTWPLDASPQKLAQQAEKVASHLQFLLRVRHVSPGTQFGKDGILAFEKHIDENAESWLRALNVRKEDLTRLKLATFDPNDHTSLDGKFFSTLLHPQPVA